MKMGDSTGQFYAIQHIVIIIVMKLEIMEL